ncbi:galactokinase [Nocardioides sp. BP30]|uniref:galactokinase n=1 Tax=Nocardioides sp. BP30 TaxID=3036374 RepID=UPI002468531D|nr:galactokinase [Nocardioides sp. BP30]WGL51394.1 galactokinase [Nocardioides sp. BP30]
MSSTPLDRVVAGFADRFGHRPDGVWSAPGRVNLIGEHTDYNEGFVLPFAIDQRTYVALALRPDRRARVASEGFDEDAEISLDDLGPTSVSGWSAYPLGTAWALGRVGGDLREVAGFDAYFVSEVPTGAGLSSSAALECSLAVALNDSWKLGLDGTTLVRAAQLAENEVVGAPTGILDQSASLLTERDAALFLDCRDATSRNVPLGLEDAGLGVLVIDTRVTHAHAGGGYASRRASCEAAASALGVSALRDVAVADLDAARAVLDDETFRRARHIVTENQRVLDTVEVLGTTGATGIGELLVASHASMRDDFEISVPELDLAVTTAMDAGAIGARMTGGGFGGSAIALVRTEVADEIGDRVTRAFAEHGFTPPRIFTVTPSAGARREQEQHSR